MRPQSLRLVIAGLVLTLFLSHAVWGQTTGIRFITAEAYIPGMAFGVAIDVKRDPGTVQVVETPPAGWTIRGIGSGGQQNAGTITWELTTFTGSSRLTYTVTPPKTAVENGIFSGKVGDSAIGGISVLYYELKSGIAVSEIEKVAGGFGFTEGPVWHRDGFLLFCADRVIKKWAPGQNAVTWLAIGANGLTYDRERRLVGCVPWGEPRSVARIEPDGSVTVIADQYQEKPLNGPNDLCVRSDGMIFFTDPDYTTRSQPFKGVFGVQPGSAPVLLVDDLVRPNGIALSPDEKKLYIADTEESMPDSAKPSFNGVRVYDAAEDGTLTNGVKFASTACDGMKVDQEGNVYISIGAVVVYSPEGDLIEIIRVPEKTLNIAFGDADNRTLYMTAGTSVYKVRVRVPGVPVWRSNVQEWKQY